MPISNGKSKISNNIDNTSSQLSDIVETIEEEKDDTTRIIEQGQNFSKKEIYGLMLSNTTLVISYFILLLLNVRELFFDEFSKPWVIMCCFLSSVLFFTSSLMITNINFKKFRNKKEYPIMKFFCFITMIIATMNIIHPLVFGFFYSNEYFNTNS